MYDKIDTIGNILLFILFFLLFPIMIYSKIAEIGKIRKGRKEIAKQFDLSSNLKEKIFSIIESTKKMNLMTISKIVIVTLLLAIIVVFLINSVKNKSVEISVTILFPIPILLIIYIMLCHNLITKHSSMIKNKFISKIIKEYDCSMTYSENGEFTKEEYLKCEYYEYAKRFVPTDFIKRKDGFKFSFFKTDSPTYNNGEVDYRMTFSGFLASIPIKRTDCKIFFNKHNEVLKKYHKLDTSDENFNNVFGIYTDDLNKASAFLNSNFMNTLLKIKSSSPFSIDLRILNDILYLRIRSNKGINISPFNIKKEINSICTYMAILDYSKKIMKELKNIIDENCG